MNEKTCKDCKYFIQHYRKAKKNYYPIYCGHCTCLKAKTCKPTKTCDNWTPIDSAVQAELFG